MLTETDILVFWRQLVEEMRARNLPDPTFGDVAATRHMPVPAAANLLEREIIAWSNAEEARHAAAS